MPGISRRRLAAHISLAAFLCTSLLPPAEAQEADGIKETKLSTPIDGALRTASTDGVLQLEKKQADGATSSAIFSESVVPTDPAPNLNASTVNAEATMVQVQLPPPTESAAISDGPIVIDNDEFKKAVQEESYKWEEIPDEPGKTHISAGARFPVYIVTSHSSKTARVGDPVEGRLHTDLKIGGRLVAAKGSSVVGHVSTVHKARKMLTAELKLNKRWMRPHGALAITFDEIVTDKGEHLPLVAMPAQHAKVIKNLNEGRVLGVNHKGEIAAPLSTQLKHQALHIAIRAGASAGGVFSFGIVPVAYATLGAINPSFAFMHHVGKNVRHRRLKGFALGLVSGLPGGFLIADSIIRGPEALVRPGDVFQAEFKQDFTGEAATSAQLLPGAKTKVHGELVEADKNKEKKDQKK